MDGWMDGWTDRKMGGTDDGVRMMLAFVVWRSWCFRRRERDGYHDRMRHIGIEFVHARTTNSASHASH